MNQRVFSLTQSREHFEKLLEDEKDEKMGPHIFKPSNQSKIDKRSQFVDQQLLQKLNQKVKSLSQENTKIKLQNQQLKSEFDACV